MEKKRFIIIASIYLFVFSVIGISSYFVIDGIKKYVNDKEEDVKIVVSDEVLDGDIVPVIKSDDNMIIKPYLSDNVSIGKSYYDYKDEESNQENSLIFYNNIYMQNNGVEYVSSESFDIVSILDGEVIGIEDSEVYGKVLTIKYSDNLTCIYSNLDNVIVGVGYNVSQGEIIASSRLYDNTNMLHFEVYHKGNTMNPESLYTLKVSDIQ